MKLLSELRIALLLAAIATVTPLAWARVDSARRLHLKQHAYALCAAHTRHLERCMHLHPGELAPDSYAMCRSGGNSHADCREFGPLPRRK